MDPGGGPQNPEKEQLNEFLDFVTRAENQPAYVHCNAGKGRTGIFVGVYRMAVEGWPPEKAFEEARQYGVNESKLEFFKQVQGWLDSGELPHYAAVRRAPLDEAHLKTMQLHPSSTRDLQEAGRTLHEPSPFEDDDDEELHATPGPAPTKLEGILAKQGKTLEELQQDSWALHNVASALLEAKGIDSPTQSQTDETLFQMNEAIKSGKWQDFEAPFGSHNPQDRGQCQPAPWQHLLREARVLRARAHSREPQAERGRGGTSQRRLRKWQHRHGARGELHQHTAPRGG